MSTNRVATQSTYGRWAGLYDRIALLPGVRKLRKRAVNALELERGDTVLDIGCGTGANLGYLREQVGSSGCVIGIDLTTPMLERARRRIDKYGWENVHLVAGDATIPPIRSEIDGVLTTFVVGLLPDPGETVLNWLTHISPGGRLAILEAAPTDSTLGRPLNVPFGVFVWLTSPGSRHWPASARARLRERVHLAETTLEDRATNVRTERSVLGFVRLVSGAPSR